MALIGLIIYSCLFVLSIASEGWQQVMDLSTVGGDDDVVCDLSDYSNLEIPGHLIQAAVIIVRARLSIMYLTPKQHDAQIHLPSVADIPVS
jgi:hypothetical protein